MTTSNVHQKTDVHVPHEKQQYTGKKIVPLYYYLRWSLCTVYLLACQVIITEYRIHVQNTDRMQNTEILLSMNNTEICLTTA